MDGRTRDYTLEIKGNISFDREQDLLDRTIGTSQAVIYKRILGIN